MMSFGNSMVNVLHELVKEKITKVPERYIRTSCDLDHEVHQGHSDDSTAANYDIPVIDIEGLLSSQLVMADFELEKLHSACPNWGFFQMTRNLIGYIIALPTNMRNPRLFAGIPLALRYSNIDFLVITVSLFAKPYCVMFEEDAAALAIVLQLNETDGLQIRKDGKWVPVKPIPAALIVNIGDMIEHRVIVNPTIERLSLATFHSVNPDAEFGPALSLIDLPRKPALFQRETVKNYYRNFCTQNLNGKTTNLDFMRIDNGLLDHSG
ncbi:hypothetical protein C5167_047744 [Papaver somniferum]|uniref:Fe2OG dioxygenase domain-containing protein n=1 Tax=Papaver somniferum TaxID=3469 RepID=A0A4Y7LKE2_PAPSO|nr:hypothetical protein C5167_047744 [Papaver somniferum]